MSFGELLTTEVEPSYEPDLDVGGPEEVVGVAINAYGNGSDFPKTVQLLAFRWWARGEGSTMHEQ